MRPLALTLAASVAALSACAGSSSGPQTLPPITSSPSATAISTPGGIPAEARASTSAGAEAFAKFFYAETVTAFETKNPDLIKAISAPGCTACDNYIRSLTKLRDNKERVENFAVDVILAVAPVVTGGTARVDVAWSTPAVAIRYDSAGKEIFRDGPYKRVDAQVNLVHRGDSWLVTAIKPIRTQK
jgi:hypothetical protein